MMVVVVAVVGVVVVTVVVVTARHRDGDAVLCRRTCRLGPGHGCQEQTRGEQSGEGGRPHGVETHARCHQSALKTIHDQSLARSVMLSGETCCLVEDQLFSSSKCRVKPPERPSDTRALHGVVGNMWAGATSRMCP